MEIRLLPNSGQRDPSSWPTDTNGINVNAAAAEYVRRPPLFLCDPHGTALGRGFENFKAIKRTPFAYRHVTDARLTGQRMIVDKNGELLLDEFIETTDECVRQLDRLCDRSSSLYHENTDLIKTENGYVCARLGNPTEFISRPAISLLSAEPSNYGSWLFRVIPKLAILKKLGLKDCCVVCWCPSKWQRDFLHFFGVDDDAILDVKLSRCYHFKEIIVPFSLNPLCFISDETHKLFRSALDANGIKRTGRRKIYISRASHARSKNFLNCRHFIDEPRLISMLQTIGFEIIEPEKLTYANRPPRSFPSPFSTDWTHFGLMSGASLRSLACRWRLSAPN